jgi:hypothetical protein
MAVLPPITWDITIRHGHHSIYSVGFTPNNMGHLQLNTDVYTGYLTAAMSTSAVMMPFLAKIPGAVHI